MKKKNQKFSKIKSISIKKDGKVVIKKGGRAVVKDVPESSEK